MTPDALFEATRGNWKVGPRREAARYALAVYAGMVVETYLIEGWQPAGTAAYKTRPVKDVQVPDRWEFRGRLADDSARSRYNGRSVKHVFPTGAQNPIRYINC